MIKIISVVGARPNFMKVSPIHKAFMQSDQIESLIVHTGQHYDAKMSDIFFNQLELPKPNYFLGVGGGSHTHQTANIMLKFEEILNDEKPDIVLVVGDVNSTMACAIVAVKSGIKTVHVEAGLRSGDKKMPEEINRILTDSICELLFVTEKSGLENLRKEGVSENRIKFVGNVMIDSLIHYRGRSQELSLSDIAHADIKEKQFVLSTMHRPSNVDNEKGLSNIYEIFSGITKHMPIVFPMHPRTKNNIKKFGFEEKFQNMPGLHILEPLGYLQFVRLMDTAAVVVTDSGGIQEETTYLQVPCITFRDSTERPITVEIGTNILMEQLNPSKTLKTFEDIISGNSKSSQIPKFWDGKTSERIRDILIEYADA